MSEKYVTGGNGYARGVRSGAYSVGGYISPIENDFAYGFDAIVDDIGPDLMLDFTSTSGATITDVGDNSLDFTADGVESTDFEWQVEPARVMPELQGRLNLTSGATRSPIGITFTEDHTIMAAVEEDAVTGYVSDVSIERFALLSQSGGSGIFDSAARYIDYELDGQFLVGASFESGVGTDLYVNGLRIDTISPVGAGRDISTVGTWTLGQRYSGSNALDIDFELFLYKNALTTAEDHYNTWLRGTRQPHHYKTHIEGTSLATGLTHAIPFWETRTRSAQSIDVSGNQNHVNLIGGVIVGKQPLELGFRNSALCNGATQFVMWEPAVNLQTDSFSLAWVSSEQVSTTRGVFGINDATNTVIATTVSGQWQLTVRGGGVSVNDRAGPEIKEHDVNQMVLTVDQATTTAKLYKDGVEICSVDFSALSFADTSAYQWRFNRAPGLTGGYNALGAMYQWDRAITPSEAAAVWAAPEIGPYPDPETKYVASDVLYNMDGTYTGGYTLSTASLVSGNDSCVAFNGTTGYVDCGFQPSLSFVHQEGVFCVNFWADLPAASGTRNLIVNSITNTVNGFYIRRLSSGAIDCGIHGDGTFESDQTTAVSPGVHMITFTGDGTTARLYVDEVERASFAMNLGGPPNSLRKLTIGAAVDGAAQGFFNGSIDEVTIAHDHADTTAISNMYAGTGPNYFENTVEANLSNIKAHWKLSEAAGTTAADATGTTRIPDSSGNGNGAAVPVNDPVLDNGRLELDKASSQYIEIEDGIAAAAATSGEFTVAIAAQLIDPDAIFAVHSSAGTNIYISFLRNSSHDLYYGTGGTDFVRLSERNHDRGPIAYVVSVDTNNDKTIVTANGVLIAVVEGRGIAALAASYLWSIGQEYDGGPTASNFSTMDVFEIDLWDAALDEDQCIAASQQLFDDHFRG